MREVCGACQQQDRRIALRGWNHQAAAAGYVTVVQGNTRASWAKSNDAPVVGASERPDSHRLEACPAAHRRSGLQLHATGKGRRVVFIVTQTTPTAAKLMTHCALHSTAMLRRDWMTTDRRGTPRRLCIFSPSSLSGLSTRTVSCRRQVLRSS